MKFFFLSIAILVAAAVAAAQQPVVNPGGIVNNASYIPAGLPNSGIAQGSMFAIFGTNLGAAGFRKVEAWPIPTEMAGTSVRVTVGGTVVNALIMYTTPTQVGALLPSSTPQGNGTLTVTYNNQTSAPAPIQVRARSFGIFTRNQAGSGPAIAQNYNSPEDQPINAINESAWPGQVMTLWGTGLGAVQGNEAAGPLPGDMNFAVEVWVGNSPARVLYKGRSGCCAGVDQVAFEVPANVEGCYLPVTVRAGAQIGNFGTIAVARQGKICSDPAGFPVPVVERAVRGENGRFGFFIVSRDREIDPQTGAITFEEGAGAQFGRLDPNRLLAARGPFGNVISPGSCAVYTGGEDDPTRPDLLDAGPALNLTGPGGTRQIMRESGDGAIWYEAELAGRSAPQYLLPGTYTVSGAGGADIGPFTATFSVPSTALSWSNESAISDIQRSQGLTVTWTGGEPGKDYVLLEGGVYVEGPDPEFTCLVRSEAGQFTVPAYVLSALPAGNGGLGVIRAYLPPEQTFTAPGLDGAYIVFVQENEKPVTFK